MIKDLSSFYVRKNAYIKCIKDLKEELDRVTIKVNNDVNTAYECAKNDIKIIEDAKKTTEQILGLLEGTQENFNAIKFHFINEYHSWLSDVSSTKPNGIEPNLPYSNVDRNQNVTIVDVDLNQDPNASEVEIIGETSDDIQIVNEITYSNHRKFSHSHNNVQGDEQSDIIDLFPFQPGQSNEANGILESRNVLAQVNHDKSLMDISFEAVANKLEQFETKETYHHLPKLDSSSNNENQENLNVECNEKNSLGKVELSNDNQNYVSSNEDQIQESTHVTSTNSKTSPSKSSLNNNQDYIIIRDEQIEEITDIPLKRLRIKLSHYIDEKLHLRCFVKLDGLHQQNLNTITSHKNRLQSTLEHDAFLRLIDLSGLERKTNKRRYSSSDDSSSSSSGKSSTSLRRKKVKRQKVCSDLSENESDITSYYESSNSDTDLDSDDDFFSWTNKFDQPDKLDDNEEKAKLMLLDDSDDTSDDSDIATDNDECEKPKKKINPTKKRTSGLKNPEEKNSSRLAWLDDELLRFKLPDDKNHETGSQKNFNDIGSTSDNEMENTEPEGIESHSKDQDNEDTNNDLQTSISIITPSRVVGRRNIRKVLDDQDITEITRQAVKDEANRIQRLGESKKQLNALLRSKTSSDKNRLILELDLETKKKLVEVDRGLVKLLKDHQKKGVRFMWDCCFESVEKVKTNQGSGCILAHCMGLGKTLQVITLVHTLLSNKAIDIKTIMIVCPMNTILNWVDEFDTWLQHVEKKSNMNIFELTQVKGNSHCLSKLEYWQENGGVLIISYDMLVSWTSCNKKFSPAQIKKLNNFLINPGADVVVCDEGHLLKNEKSKRADRMQSVGTQRRIILTGTPLQNNLNEYHCMVEFVKPHLLGSKAEFGNRFGNPIANGQFDNSTPYDVRLMKHRAHVLHGLLEGCVQRCDYSVLTPLLPPKQEYVISVHLSKLQKKMYEHFISNVAKISKGQSYLFKNYQEIKRLVAHPKIMQLKMQRPKKTKERSETDRATDSNGIDDWWRDLVKEEDLEDMNISFKLVLLFGLLESCKKKGDKVLLFSQCLSTLDLIELFLKKSDSRWKRELDYFRLDGSVDSSKRSRLCKQFNDPTNKRARLFLISTKAGGLGINLIGANRVVVFDPSWNPSNDLQSIFRVFRFGQKKPCFIYRFLTAGTMEEKIYFRQVTKLSLSLRVLDEQQVGRHYSDTDLTDLYKLETLPEAEVLNSPKDDLLAEVFAKYGKHVYKYFEHDSLLENQEEEELNEEERKQAWLDYHQENQPSNDATAAKSKGNQRRKLSESSVDSSVASVTSAASSDETTDHSD